MYEYENSTTKPWFTNRFSYDRIKEKQKKNWIFLFFHLTLACTRNCTPMQERFLFVPVLFFKDIYSSCFLNFNTYLCPIFISNVILCPKMLNCLKLFSFIKPIVVSCQSIYVIFLKICFSNFCFLKLFLTLFAQNVLFEFK